MLFYFVGVSVFHVNMTSQIQFKLLLIWMKLSFENK